MARLIQRLRRQMRANSGLPDEDGGERTYRLVGPDEFDVAAGLISVDAPLGRGLIGRAEGESVRIERPAGTLEVTVVAVAWERPGGS